MSLSLPPALRAPAFEPGTVWLVGAGPGDPGLLTLHALHALQGADVVLHDALVNPEILRLAGPRARLEHVGKRAGRASPKQMRINERLVALAREGLRVLRLKGGDPFVFGRGGEEALSLAAAGVPFRVVPGVTSGIAGPAYAGIPATHRNLTQALVFVTGRGAGGAEPREVDWAALAKGASVLVVYMGLGRVGEIARALVDGGRSGSEPVALIADATTERQAVARATLDGAEAAAASLPADAPALIVVGPNVELADVLLAWQQTTPARVPAEAGTSAEATTAL